MSTVNLIHRLQSLDNVRFQRLMFDDSNDNLRSMAEIILDSAIHDLTEKYGDRLLLVEVRLDLRISGFVAIEDESEFALADAGEE